MKVFLTGPHAFASVHNEGDLRLSSYLESQGWELTQSDDIADVVCAVEMPLNAIHRPKTPRLATKNGLLIVQEPSVVRPYNAAKKRLAQFSSVIEVGRVRNGAPTRWPALYLNEFDTLSRTDKELRACLIAANKVSVVPGELYSLRRAVIDSSTNIDLFGPGWDSPTSTRIKQVVFEVYIGFLAMAKPDFGHLKGFFSRNRQHFGPVEDKLATNSRYKVSVVIENSQEYMSEKLLDAISAASIPVYVGPKVEDFGIPRELIVQVDPAVESVNAGIQKALEMDYAEWVVRCSKWLNETNLEDWGLENLWKRIHKTLLAIAIK
jgi:hypothetical protein